VSAPTIDRLLHDDATLLRRSATGPADEYGNPTYEVVEEPTRCRLEQAGTREELDGAVQVGTWRIFLPLGAPARGWDAVRLADGRVLELQGDAYLAHSALTGAPHHVEAYVRGTE
jgi:hypothetical protein